MCGIAGCFGTSINSNWVDSALQLMQHRGPDNTNSLEFNDHLKMGSTRLAMVDPHPRSNQPFTDEKNNGVLAFNGEIYNYGELKNYLSTSDGEFKTKSDTEVLFKLLEKYGTESIKLLNGMFSFSYFSRKTNNLILARDMLGKKPLFYTMQNGNFYWSSSLHSLTKIRDSKVETNDLTQYFVLGYFVDPETIYRGIYQVKPGEVLEINSKNVITHKKIEINKLSNKQKSEKYKLRQEIENAIDVRVRDHDKFAISLSGGIDSTIIALCSAKLMKKVTAYSMRWPNADKAKYNKDSETAKIIADKLSINFIEINIFEPDELSNYLNKFLIAMEEPNSNPTGLSMTYLYENMHKYDERLALTGDGADEILGGYPRYEQIEKLPRKLASALYVITRILPQNVETKQFRSKLQQLSINQNKPMFWLYWHLIFNEGKLEKYLDKSIYNYRKFSEMFESHIEEAISNTSFDRRYQYLMNLDHKIWLPNESNRRLDRVSMAASIEARSPFQDEKVINIANKVNRKFTSIKKKDFLYNEFPELHKLGITQKKQGFISPIGYWLRNNLTLVNKSLEILDENQIIKHKNIDNLISGIVDGNFDLIQQAWNLVVLAAWINLYEK